MFLNCINSCFLYQHVLEPTRFREDQEPSTLGLILTNEEGMISNLNYDPGLGASDHCLLAANSYIMISTSNLFLYS